MGLDFEIDLEPSADIKLEVALEIESMQKRSETIRQRQMALTSVVVRLGGLYICLTEEVDERLLTRIDGHRARLRKARYESAFGEETLRELERLRSLLVVLGAQIHVDGDIHHTLSAVKYAIAAMDVEQ